MADATVTITSTNQYLDGEMYRVFGTLAISSSPDTYPSSGGLTMSFRTAAVKASRAPIRVLVEGQDGYVYRFIPGTDSSNGHLKIFTGAAAQSPLTELSAGAIAAGISGDIITFEATFRGML